MRSSLRVETDFPPEDVVEKSGSTSAAASSPTKGRRKMGTAPAVVTVPDSEEEDDGLDSDADDHDHSDTDDADHLDNSDTPKWGIHALPLDHSPLRSYVAKARSMFEFERLGCCVSSSCGRQPLIPAAESGELIAICPNDGCEAAGHVACWSEELLREENAAARREGRPQEIVPIEGTCPSCGGNIRWVDMMKELTLRERGGKEVDRLLRKKRGIPAGSAA